MILGRDTVTVLRAGSRVDGYGKTRPGTDWAASTSTVVTGCSVQPASAASGVGTTEHVTSLGDLRVTGLRLFAPAGSDITARDRVVIDGLAYDVDGEIGVFHDAVGRADHIEAFLRRTEG